jgi:hypothetical protein
MLYMTYCLLLTPAEAERHFQQTTPSPSEREATTPCEEKPDTE